MDRRNGRSNGRRAAESNGRRAAAESNGRHSSVPPQTTPPPPVPVPSPPAQAPPTPSPAELAARSAAYFDELFGPSSRGTVRGYASSSTATNSTHPANGTPAAGNGGESSTNRGNDTYYQMARNPWQYDSSIFYGGQEDVYVRPRPPPRRPEDDINDETYCNIGDWWKGSYHY